MRKRQRDRQRKKRVLLNLFFTNVLAMQRTFYHANEAYLNWTELNRGIRQMMMTMMEVERERGRGRSRGGELQRGEVGVRRARARGLNGPWPGGKRE